MVTRVPQHGQSDNGGGGQQPWLIAVVVLAFIGEGVALILAHIEVAVIVALYTAEITVVAPMLANTRHTKQIHEIVEKQTAEAPERDAQLVQDITQATGDILADSSGTSSPFPRTDPNR